MYAFPVENAIELCSDRCSPEDDKTPLDELLLLVKRVDDVRLRSEATRVLVNAVRAIFGPASAAAGSDARLASSRSRLSQADIATAIGELARISAKYPMLVNEGVVALALLAAKDAAAGTSAQRDGRRCWSSSPELTKYAMQLPPFAKRCYVGLNSPSRGPDRPWAPLFRRSPRSLYRHLRVQRIWKPPPPRQRLRPFSPEKAAKRSQPCRTSRTKCSATSSTCSSC